MLNFEVDTTDRLDKYLASKVDASRSRVQKVIKEGSVSVNDKAILDTDFKVNAGDKISIPDLIFDKQELKASEVALNVVFENKDLAVIDKPPGMVVHPGAGNTEDTLSQALLTYFPETKNVGEPHRPGIVHRLDEDTSGLIVIAKTPEAYEFLKKSFVEKTIQKEYLALVHGTLDKTHGMIDAPLEKVPMKQRMKVGSGKEALTEYWVIGSSVNNNVGDGFSLPRQGGLKTSPTESGSDPSSLQYSLIRVKLHTGRTHQIRAHMAHLNHPIVGDPVYGASFANTDRDVPRQFLHAFRLKFQLLDGTWLELESDLPNDLKVVLQKTGISYKL